MRFPAPFNSARERKKFSNTQTYSELYGTWILGSAVTHSSKTMSTGEGSKFCFITTSYDLKRIDSAQNCDWSRSSATTFYGKQLRNGSLTVHEAGCWKLGTENRKGQQRFAPAREAVTCYPGCINNILDDCYVLKAHLLFREILSTRNFLNPWALLFQKI